MILFLPIITLLLPLLTTATPPPLTNPLQPQTVHPTCSPTYGTHIHALDCVHALRNIPAYNLNVNTNSVLQNLGRFSRTSPISRYRLPQRSTVGSCTLYIDLVHPGPDSNYNVATPAPLASWMVVGDGAGKVILECADKGGGVGGWEVSNGFFTAVYNGEERNGIGGGRGAGGWIEVVRGRRDACIREMEMDTRVDTERCIGR